MALAVQKYKVRIKLLEDMLGTVPKNKKVYETYIAGLAADHAAKATKDAEKKGGDPRWADGKKIGEDDTEETRTPTAVIAEEVETVQEREERGWTGFHKDDQGSFIYNYTLKGFLCEAARTIKEWGVVKQLQDKFKRYAFVQERRIHVSESSEVNERPLRELSAPVS